MIDENLYWHVEHVYDSLVKYFGICNHVKTIIFENIARQFHFGFVHSRMKYGTEVFEDCANEYLQQTGSNTKPTSKIIIKFWPTNLLSNCVF